MHTETHAMRRVSTSTVASVCCVSHLVVYDSSIKCEISQNIFTNLFLKFCCKSYTEKPNKPYEFIKLLAELFDFSSYPIPYCISLPSCVQKLGREEVRSVQLEFTKA